MKTFHKFGKENISVPEMEKHRQELRKKMSGAEKKMAMKKAEAPAGKKLSPKDLHLGDAVKVLSMNLKGTVSSLPDAKGNLFVQMGIMRSGVSIQDLVLLDDPGDHRPLSDHDQNRHRENENVQIFLRGDRDQPAGQNSGRSGG